MSHTRALPARLLISGIANFARFLFSFLFIIAQVRADIVSSMGLGEWLRIAIYIGMNRLHLFIEIIGLQFVEGSVNI